MAGGMFAQKKPPAMPTMGAAGPENKYSTALGGFGQQSKGVPNLSSAMGMAKGAMPSAPPAGQLGAAMGMRNAAAGGPPMGQGGMQEARAKAMQGAAAGRQAQMARAGAMPPPAPGMAGGFGGPGRPPGPAPSGPGAGPPREAAPEQQARMAALFGRGG